MDRNLDRSLDEILADRQQSKRGGDRGNRNSSNNSTGRRRERVEYPRDGVRKSYRDDAPRDLDTEWVHDRFEESGNRRSGQRRRGSPKYSSESRGSKIRVENIHYELTEDDLDGLFNRIGPVVKLELRYDRAGRSEGVAYVTYESNRDAQRAIDEFDGANAAGLPIRLTLVPTGPSGGSRRNPFDNAIAPGRPLAERITRPADRTRSLSPTRARDLEDEDAARKGIDRYRPRAHSRSPVRNRRQGGRRPGARSEQNRGGRSRGGAANGGGEGRAGGNPRPKKTAEELDAEMEVYFGGGGGNGADAAPANVNGNGAHAAEAAPVDDVEMIE